MRRSPSNTHKSQRSPKQALHTRFSPKMEIIGTNFSKHNFDVKPEASSMLMLSPKQGIFGTLTKGISKVSSSLNKATEVYNKGQQLHQQARQVYSQIPQPYPQQPQQYSQPPQQYPQSPQVYSQIPKPYPQPVQSITTHKKLHSSIVRKQCS